MYYELALISVLVAGGYWGVYFVRHPVTRAYGAYQLIAAGLAGLGLLGRHLEQSAFGIAGAIGVGAGVCLLVLGPLARGIARRFAAAERFTIAQRLLDVSDVLAPGSGVGEEKALVGAMREIREGNIEQTVDALTHARERAPAEARLAIDERIAMLYLAAYRWDDAISYAETHLFAAPLDADDPDGDGAAATPSPVALRRALGLAPPVWVELLGAYGYLGNLDQAARMLARLEDVCANRPEAAIWLHRGRMIFLAHAGRVGAVRSLVEPRRSRHMKPAARRYWIGVAHERSGDGASAQAAYVQARAGTRGRPRILIERALERLAAASGEPAALGVAELGPIASEVVARVEAEPVPEIAERTRPRGPIATRVSVAAVLAVAATIALALGPSSDVGVLMRGGAMVRGLVHDGEWWRLVSCVFVHVGGLHLIVNVIGLWFLGRLAEELFGPWRMLALFGVSGLAGSVASFLASPAGISAGASGAIFGLLGAVFVELTWQRRHHRAAWTRGVWGSLAVVTIAQLGIGFFYPVIDQWAHGAGLLAGLIAGLALSPHARWAALGQHVARALALAVGLAAVGAFVQVVRTPIAASLASAPRALREVGSIRVVAPVSWQVASDELYDPDLFIVLSAQRTADAAPLAVQLAAYADAEPDRARGRKFDEVDIATAPIVALPSGWEGRELVVSVEDPLGGRQRYRVIVAGYGHPSGVVLASLYVPETVARAAPEVLTALLATVEPR
jgi:rhomboid protease GluP